MKDSRAKIFLLLILISATTIRLEAILKYGQFWGDEMFSFIYSQKPWIDSLFDFWIWETNPPLHMFFLKLWFYIFPANEFWSRLPSLIFGIGGVFTLYNFSKRIFSKEVGLVSALIIALSADHVFYSATARTYSLLALLSILSCDYFFRIFIEKNTTKKNLLLYGLINLFLLYSHLTGLAVLTSQFIILIASNKKSVRLWINLNLIPGLLWLIWAIPSLAYKTNFSTAGGAWFLNMSKQFTVIIKNLQLIFTGPTNVFYGLGVMTLFATGLAFLFYKERQKINDKLLLIAILAVIPITESLFVGLFNIRFLFISLPWIAVISAYLLNYYYKNILLCSLMAIALLTPGLKNIFTAFPLNDWGSVSELINKKIDNSKKQLVIYNDFNEKNEIDRYLRIKQPVLTYFPNPEIGWDYFLITQNYIFSSQPQTQIASWLNDNKIKNYDEIFLLENPDRGIDVLQALKNMGWKENGPSVPLKTVIKQELFDLKK